MNTKTYHQIPTASPMITCSLPPLRYLVLGCAFLFATFTNAQSTLTLITASDTNGSIESGDILEMEVGRQAIILTNWDIIFVGVADSTIAGVNVLTDENDLAMNEVRIVSESLGKTDLIIRGVNGEFWACEIHVDKIPEHLNADLSKLFPSSRLTVTRSEDVYFIQGIMRKSDDVENMHHFLDNAGINYVDMTVLAGLHQVQIQVRVAEVNRVAIKRMTVNALYGSKDVIAASMTGSAAGGSFSQFNLFQDAGHSLVPGTDIPFAADVSNSPLTTLFAGFPRADLSFFIQALAENQYVNLLAEPTLVAMSGEEAQFLAGGEFPVPSGNNSNNNISITYKEVGIRLKFRPEVLGDGTIRLYIDTEVSEISDFGGIEAQGIKIPSIITRRVQTTLEMKSGQTFAMAGLLNHSTQVKNSRIPLLGDIPILGALFRSVSYQLGETELVILVTPSLVEPVSYAELPMLPGEQYVPPNDWELMALGKIGRSETENDSPDPDMLTQLKGPGAWDDREEANE